MALDEYWKKVMDSGFDHPCKQTCSGWQQGYDRGVEAERARVMKALPSDENLFKEAEYIRRASCEVYGEDSWEYDDDAIIKHSYNALIALRERINLVCGEKGGET